MNNNNNNSNIYTIITINSCIRIVDVDLFVEYKIYIEYINNYDVVVTGVFRTIKFNLKDPYVDIYKAIDSLYYVINEDFADCGGVLDTTKLNFMLIIRRYTNIR